MTAPAEPMPTLRGPAADVAPEVMTHAEKTRLRNAAFQAKRVYPGPVGELISREILSAEEFSYRFGGQTQIRALVDHVLKPPTS